MNNMSISGYVCNLKSFPGENGNTTLSFSISSKTGDYKRMKEENNNRDFFDVVMFIPSSRANLTNYIKDRAHIQVGGIPFQEIGNDGKRYFKLKALIEMFSFMPSGNGQNPNSTNNSSENYSEKADTGSSQQQAGSEGQKTGW